MNRLIVTTLLLGVAPTARSLSAHDVSAPPGSEIGHVALPPELDNVLRDYERAWRADNAFALASLFAADGFVLQSKHLPAHGRQAIQAAYEGKAGGPLRLDALAFSAGDTEGYIFGVYGYGNVPGDMGKFTLTLRGAPGGAWVIFSDMDNLNAPPRRQQ